MPKLDDDVYDHEDEISFEPVNGAPPVDDQLKYALYDCERAVRDLYLRQDTLVDKTGELQSAILDLTEEIGFDKLRTDIIALTDAVRELKDEVPSASNLKELTIAILRLTERLGDPDPVATPVSTGFKFSEPADPAPVTPKPATRRGKRG